MTRTAKKSTSLTVQRTYDASPERVYRAFTHAEDLSRWYGPSGMATYVDELEVRVGGAFEMTMRNDESAYTCYGTFLELVPPGRIVHTWRWMDEDWDDDTMVTIEIRPATGGTEVVLTHQGFRDGEEANGHAEGWAESLERLACLLESDGAAS